MEKTRSVSRCVAVAAHGRRCQQSPFRGSPYCWHHTQSRKVWAPSRPLAANGPMRLVDDQAVIVAPPTPPELTTAEIATAERLLRALGPERAQALLSFLDGTPGADDFTIVRERVAQRRPPAPRLRRQAAG
ncbi:MAG: hypothetical protein QOD86_2594 [Miltoncostaeaceae bacterium]|jgi:hypothetical protein|nr:hypothetical protein [Miltoncostaeaceae bacterium]